METRTPSLHWLAQEIGFDTDLLRQFVYNRREHIHLEKKKKTNGQIRTITVPSKQFKNALRIINRRLLQPIGFHKCFYLKPKSSFYEMLRSHRQFYFTWTCDIDDFYPSISSRMIMNSLLAKGFDKENAELLTRLTTHNNQLPQGFPTSSSLAAFVLIPILDRLEGLYPNHKLFVSLYADNVAISAKFDPRRFKGTIIRVFQKYKFRLDKFSGLEREGVREIMGSVKKRGSGYLVARQYIRNLRDRIFSLSKDLEHANTKGFRKTVDSIRGKLAFVRTINANQFNSLARHCDRLHVALVLPKSNSLS